MIDRPTAIVVDAIGWIRPMEPRNESGGSEPHRFTCSDGEDYLVKASNNPQKGRVLVNELVCGPLLGLARGATPRVGDRKYSGWAATSDPWGKVQQRRS